MMIICYNSPQCSFKLQHLVVFAVAARPKGLVFEVFCRANALKVNEPPGPTIGLAVFLLAAGGIGKAYG